MFHHLHSRHASLLLPDYKPCASKHARAGPQTAGQPTPIPQRTQVGVPTLPHGSFAPLGPYSCFLWESPAWACFPGDWPTAGVETGTVTNSGRLLCFWIVTTENHIVKSVNPETVEWRRSAHSHLHRYIQAGRPSSRCHRNPQSAQAMTFDL